MAPTRQWKDFRRRLERTRAPAAVPPVLPPAEGAQLALARRQGPGDDGDETVTLEVTNLGCEEARPRAEVRDAGGKKVGRVLLSRHGELAPGERREISLTPSHAQWQALREGGRLVISPGDLPEARRTFRLHGTARPATGTLEWEVPVPHVGVFELPAEGGRGAEMGVSLDLQTSDRGDTLLRAAPLETRPEGASLALLLPYEEVRYRFRRGGETFRDPHNPAFAAPPHDDWSLRSPGFLRRTWKLPPTSSPVAGRLTTSPSGRLRVASEWIEAAPGEEPEIRLELETGWLVGWTGEPETVKVHLADAEGRRRWDLLEATLLRRRLSEPAVRLAGAAPDGRQVRLQRAAHGRGQVDLALENPGSRQAVVHLRVGDTHRSSKAKVPPTPSPPPEEPTPYRFELSGEAAEAVREAAAAGKPLTASLASDERVFWDTAAVAFRPEVVQLEKAVDRTGQVEGGKTEPRPRRWVGVLVASLLLLLLLTGGVGVVKLTSAIRQIVEIQREPDEELKSTEQTLWWCAEYRKLDEDPTARTMTIVEAQDRRMLTFDYGAADDGRLWCQDGKLHLQRLPWVPVLEEEGQLVVTENVKNEKEQRGVYFFFTEGSPEEAVRRVSSQLADDHFEVRKISKTRVMSTQSRFRREIVVSAEPTPSGARVEVRYAERSLG